MEGEDDREVADMQMAIQMSLTQEQPWDNGNGAGPSNVLTDSPVHPLPVLPTALPTALPPSTSPLPKSIPKEVYSDSLSKDYDATSLAHLQAMLGDPKAQFRSPAQYHLYKKILARDCHLVSVSGTGSGKTLPFQLAMRSWEKNIRGIMVLPYQILHGDMRRRMVEIGLTYSKWEQANPAPRDQVVTIAIESFGSPACINWLRGVAKSGKLGIIMFDEAHGLVEDKRFRESYGMSVRKLMAIRGCTIMFCSATLSPHFMEDFWRVLKIGFRPEDCILTIRSPTQRVNIFYQVLNLQVGTQPKWGVEAMDAWTSKWIEASGAVIRAGIHYLEADERGLVFFVSDDECKLWAVALGCTFITGEVGSGERDRHFADWRSGKTNVLCLNKAGFYGFDFPRVRFAVMIGAPMCMTDYMQSSGRIGRDGEPAMCLTLLPHNVSEPNQNDPETFSGRRAIREMIWKRGQCLRLIPSQHMDGRDVTCVELWEKDRETVLCGECLELGGHENVSTSWTEPWGKRPFRLRDR